MGMGVGDAAGVSVGVKVGVGVGMLTRVAVGVSDGVQVGTSAVVAVGSAAVCVATIAVTVASISGVGVGVGVGKLAIWVSSAASSATRSGVGSPGWVHPASTARAIENSRPTHAAFMAGLEQRAPQSFLQMLQSPQELSREEQSGPIADTRNP